MSEYKLSQEIINLSFSKIWEQAKLEWQLAEIYHQDEPDTCLCGHYPINEICVITNKINSNSVEIGNVCVKKFIGLPSDKIFRSLKRIAKDDSKALSAEAIQHASDKKWINSWETNFYFDTIRKRKLSTNQLAKRKQINQLVLRQTRR